MTNSQYYDAMLGGENGGKYIATGSTEQFDFIIAGVGVTFTVLTDDADANLLTAKALTGITMTEKTLFHAGRGKKIKTVTYTGGNVFGYNYGSSQI